MRDKIVAGNWKMNTTPGEGMDLIRQLLDQDLASDVVKVVIPPFTHLELMTKSLAGTSIQVGAQDVSAHESGAYTGEVSADMIRACGVHFALVGHSERRAYHGETETILSTKLNNLLAKGIRPVYCCGEELSQRKSGEFLAVVESQIKDGISHLSVEEMKQVVIAYEPVWAIGTGETASPEQAQEVHAHIRGVLTQLFNGEVADSTSILYGGSVKPGNARELFGQPDIDGGLIGGASLKAGDFAAIINSY
jgi:triosephosphate isomerase